MKKLIIAIFLLASVQEVAAQRDGGFRFQMDLGAAIPKDGGIGALMNLEPQILVKSNLAFGVRVGIAGLAKDVVYFNDPEQYEGELGVNASIVGTLNYYFNKGNSRVAPYLGAGFGYYGFSSVDVDTSDAPEDIGNLEADFAWAPMLRAGVELGKFRLGAEYNFVPSSDLQNINGETIGTAVNEYFGFTLGFFLGGGRWGK
ncbi:hypothetical protein [Algoriphagus confluentis]|uniref:Outer membrane protein beta-barrel domain-containing protein n=1 Tax=Algoriphagus confluentis TaxID=1697556 RepID=A0ABQ6PS46_9BACT|nr:hypothetical protein Aconfl_34590 [Algoriphagus confluentis]